MKEQSQSIIELAKALCHFQSEVDGAKRTSENPFYKSKYADLAEVWKTIRQPLTNAGLSVAQGNSQSADQNYIIVTTLLMHNSGEYLYSELPIRLEKQDPQTLGKAITYGRRYALTAMLGIHQEDDDANCTVDQPKQTQPKASTPKQTKPAPAPFDKQKYIDRLPEILEKLDGLGITWDKVLARANMLFGVKKDTFDEIFAGSEDETKFASFFAYCDGKIADLSKAGNNG